MSEAARLAELSDLPAIEAINQSRRAEIVDQRGGPMYLAREIGPDSIGSRLEAAMASDDAIVVVGTYDEVVFGYGHADIETLLDGSRVAHLQDFVVEADAREAGIGEAMMNLIVDSAKQAGCRGIDSTALPGDRSTKNFFESFGLKARMLVVHRAFDDE